MLIHLLPDSEATFSSAELHEIAQAMNMPAVRKYLKKEAYTALAAIATGLPKVGESANDYLIRQAQVVGSLGVLNAFLGIEKPVRSIPSQS